jgi:hypothetical protein
VDPSRVRQVGPYPVRRLHAEGGQAWIFEVDDPKFGVRRALKALKPQGGPAGSFERFRREAQALASLSHPNLVTPFDFGRDEATGWFYYTMAFVEGQSLAGRLTAGATLDLAELRAVFVPVLDALCAVHAAGFVHRDIKPSNILVSSQGNAWLADLGIMIGGEEEAAERTQTGVALGSALYMSPEQARGRREEIGPATDVFSLGLVIYQALSGKAPYEGTEADGRSGAEILMYLGTRLYRGQELELPLPDSVPGPLQRFVRKACRLSAADRYANAREMREAFAAALDEAEGRGAPAPRSRWLAPLYTRNGRLALAALALAAALAAAWLALRTWTAPGRAAAALERASELQEEVAALLGEARIDDSQLDIELRLAERGARFELDAARAYRSDGLDEAALTRADRALLRFEDLCGRLVLELQARALAGAAALEERSQGFERGLPEELRASKLLPQRFAEMSGRIAELREASTGSACERARGQLARLASVPAIEAAQGELEKALDPKIAGGVRSLRDAAVDARGRALANPALHRRARVRIEDGERALARGEREQRAGNLFAAAKSFAEARAAFAEVPAMEPALAAKLAYESREREVREAGAGSLRSAGRVYDFAERLLIEGRYAEAEREYRSALALLEATRRPGAEPAP